jgi:RAQPRD family integrative conjugative element protein
MTNRFRKRLLQISMAILLLGLVATNGFADEILNTQLAQIAKELEYLKEEVSRIELSRQNQEVMSDPKFDFSSLKQELGLIQGGLSDYVEHNIRIGRPIEPVEGVYR